MKRYAPQVGDKVQLNSDGYELLRLSSAEAHEQAKNMTITRVIQIGRPSDPIWSIEVDAPLINIFMLDASMVKLKERSDFTPKCQYCGTREGLAFGTGDCGCQSDPY